MNALLPIDDTFSPRDQWGEAQHRLNAWRGRLLDAFARAEADVSETLLFLSQRLESGHRVKLRRMVGQRLDDLACLVAPGGPCGPAGERTAGALRAFRAFDELRVILCHGTARVALDRHGRWVAVFKLLAFAGNEAQRSSRGYDARDAERIAADLDAGVNALTSALQSLRDQLRHL